MRASQYGVNPGAPPRIRSAEAKFLAQIARERSGVVLPEDNHDFLESRVGRRLKEIGCASFADYATILRGPRGKRRHFDWLEETGIAHLTADGAGIARPLVAWSAACSTGAELWSIGMLLDGVRIGDDRPIDWQLVGTDISRRILRRSTKAIFVEDELDGLAHAQRTRYLMRERNPPKDGAARRYRIVPEMRRRARFLQANLLALGVAPGFEADIAFLRNVLIYFDPADQHRAAAGVVARLRRGGFLLTGHTERVRAGDLGLVQIAAAIYRKEGG